MGASVVAVIGLGYVGLPLAVQFASQYETIGFDVSHERVTELRSGVDRTLEVESPDLIAAHNLRITDVVEDLASASVFVVAVPTPIDEFKRPDLQPLRAATTTVGSVMRPGSTVVFESTVYPGATEEVCVPILEAVSGHKLNETFTVGYSPERINPGDKERRLPSIVKVTSGSNPQAAEFIDQLYSSIIPAGTHRAPSIRAAEAAKVIENTQRDVNIALINELAILFNLLGVDTGDVLAAAASKWNFLPFRPGLVGGHCIGVDPYYLTHKAESVGYHPQMILAGRRINDSMGAYVAEQVVKLMAQRHLSIGGARALVLGLTFKENVPDLRNSKAIDIIERLREYSVKVDVSDPWANPEEAASEYGVSLLEADDLVGPYDAIVLAVDHDKFRDLAGHLRRISSDNAVVFDVKGALPRHLVSARL